MAVTRPMSKNSRPIAQIIPINEVKPDQDEAEHSDKMLRIAKEVMDEYDDLFAELAKSSAIA